MSSAARRRPGRPCPPTHAPLRGQPDWVCRAALRAVHDGRQRLRVDFEDNVIKLVRAIGRKAHRRQVGWGFTTWRQLAQVLYGADVILTDDDVQRVRKSVRRWARGAERAGLVAFEEALSPDGGSACLRWRQLDPLTDAADPAAVAEAVDQAPVRDERIRVRYSGPDRERQRWTRRCARAGRGAARRLIDPAAHRRFHYLRRSDPPCRSSLASPGTTSSGRAHAHEAGPCRQTIRLDAIERACPASHRAALRRWRTAASSREPWIALQAAADQGAVEALPAALAAWAIASEGREPRLSRSMSAQLERSAAQLDRIAGRGAAAGWIVHRIAVGLAEDDADYGRRRIERRAETNVMTGRRFEVAVEVNAGVESIAFYVLQLRQLARQARRNHRGAPPPRPWRARGRI